MKILYSQFTARPGKGEEVAELLRGLTRDVRTEPGNRAFDPYRESEDSDKFFVFEAYADEDAFHTHLGMPYGKPFNDALNELIVEPHSMLTFLDAME